MGINFGLALDALKKGQRVCRSGWNGKGMYIYLFGGNTPTMSPVSDEEPYPLIEGVRQDLFALGPVGTTIRLPHINMRAASGSIVTGWLASQTDMLAEDWEVLPNDV